MPTPPRRVTVIGPASHLLPYDVIIVEGHPNGVTVDDVRRVRGVEVVTATTGGGDTVELRFDPRDTVERIPDWPHPGMGRG